MGCPVLTTISLSIRRFLDRTNSPCGYALDNWQQLAHDIRQQILVKEAVSTKQTSYGEYFEISASLRGPNGVRLQVKTVWMSESQSGITKFITLYPDRGR